MTEEQERLLHAVHAGVVESNVKLDSLTERLSAHEEEDARAHSRIGKLETDRTKLFAYYAAAAVVIPLVIWVLSAIHGSASAQ